MTSYAQNLREARLRIGLSQAAVAKHLGTTQASIANLERGFTKLEFDRARELARLYAVPLQWFIDGQARPGEAPNACLIELAYLGLRDLSIDEADIPGSCRRVEEIASIVAAGPIEPRLLEGLPFVLLRNPTNSGILAAFSEAHDCRARLAWIADVGRSIAAKIPGVPPAHLVELDRFIESTARPTTSDSLGFAATAPKKLDRLAKRWRMTYSLDLGEVTRRTIELWTRDVPISDSANRRSVRRR